MTMKTIQISRVLTMLVTRCPSGVVLAVVVGQQVQDVDRHLGGEVLARVVQAVEEDLGLGLVGGHVVAHLGGPDGPALVAGADGEDLHDARVRSLHVVDVGDHLRVVVVAAVVGRVVDRRRRRGIHAGRLGRRRAPRLRATPSGRRAGRRAAGGPRRAQGRQGRRREPRRDAWRRRSVAGIRAGCAGPAAATRITAT